MYIKSNKSFLKNLNNSNCVLGAINPLNAIKLMHLIKLRPISIQNFVTFYAAKRYFFPTSISRNHIKSKLCDFYFKLRLQKVFPQHNLKLL